MCVYVCESLSCVQLFATPWTVACQAPLCMGILQARRLEWVAIGPSGRTQLWGHLLPAVPQGPWPHLLCLCGWLCLPPLPPRHRGLRRRVGGSLGALAFLNVLFYHPGDPAVFFSSSAGAGDRGAESGQAMGALATALSSTERVTSRSSQAGVEGLPGSAFSCLSPWPPEASCPQVQAPSRARPASTPSIPTPSPWATKHTQHTRKHLLGKRK